MTRLLRWLFTGDGHQHQWETEKEEDIFSRSDNHKGWLWVKKCTICHARSGERVTL